MKLGKVLGMNEVAAAGMVATLANNIPMFQMLKTWIIEEKLLISLLLFRLLSF